MADSLLDPVASIAVADEAPSDALQVADLKLKLHRERSRRQGLERGIQALSERLADLQRENAELRARVRS